MLMKNLNIKYMKLKLKFKLKINIRIMMCKIITLQSLCSSILWEFNKKKSTVFDFYGHMLLLL